MNPFVLLFATFLFVAESCSTKNAIAENNTETTQTKSEVSKKATFPVDEYTQQNNLESYSQAVFAGGCFWCTEAAFERIIGVVDVISGYAGGHVKYPDYYGVGAGKTGHAEAIFIYYDSSKIDYATLLDVFFVAHDPTTLNRQGPDKGEEYRSAIFYQSETELTTVNEKIEALDKSNYYKNDVVTELKAYDEFWVAEAYHQNYYELNPNHGYVVSVSRPKVEKVKKEFPNLIKGKYKS